MALQVWLPLNGNLKDQGLADINLINSGATISSEGKIGQCYSFDGSDDYLYTSNYTNLGNNFSVTCWVYFNIISTGCILCTRSATYGGLFIYLTSGNMVIDPTASSFSNGVNRWTTTFTPQTETWYHLVITRTPTEISYYIDGELRQTKTVTYGDNYGNTLTIGCRSTNGESRGVFLNGKLNDLRIYNHCLSPKEIKEISKGLVLHYKLDSQQNLINFDLSTTNYTITNYANRTPGTISNGTYYVVGHQDSTYIDTFFAITSNQYIDLASDTDYYLSFYCKCKNDTDTFFGNGSVNQANTMLIGTSGNKFKPLTTVYIGKQYDGLVVLKIHTGTDTQYKISIGFDTPNLFGIGSFIQFSSIALTTIEPSNILDDSNTIHDCSGYQNDGIIIGNSSSNVSPRYSSAISMNNTGTTNHIETDLLSFSDNIVSVSFWVKSAKASNHVLFAYPGKIVVGQLSNLMCVQPTGSGMFNLNNFKNNDWNHVVAIRNGDSYQLFINGSQETRSTSSNYYVHNGNKVWLLNRNYNTYYAANAIMSDVRLYTTVLSEEDIKELYNTSAVVDNLGNDYCYQFEELMKNIELNPPLDSFNHTSGVSQFDGKDLVFTGKGSSYSNFIEVDVSKTLTYDITFSNQEGSWFLIGFERYDENKTSVSNSGCIYVIDSKNTVDHKRISGVLTLSDVNGNPCKFTKIRVLNCWNPQSTITDGIGKIHSFHFTQSFGSGELNITKQGQMKGGWFIEDEILQSQVSKNKYITANQLIEI